MYLAVLRVVVGSVFDQRSLSERWICSTVLWFDHYTRSLLRSVATAYTAENAVIKLVQTVLHIEILAGESPKLIIQPQ